MSRDLFQRVVFAVVFVVVLLALGKWRLPANFWPAWKSSVASETPQDAIYGMLDAARAGDTKTYLDWFAGEIRDQLLQIVRENSEPTLAAYLKSQNSAFHGVAVSVTDRPSQTEATVRVEYVYSGHNEVQDVYLRKGSSGWKIVKVANAEPAKTLFPFGTAVTD
jgi:hypothetical protein